MDLFKLERCAWRGLVGLDWAQREETARLDRFFGFCSERNGGATAPCEACFISHAWAHCSHYAPCFHRSSPNRRIAFFVFLALRRRAVCPHRRLLLHGQDEADIKESGQGSRHPAEHVAGIQAQAAEVGAQRAELRTQVALFPSTWVGEKYIRLAATLGVAGSEAAPGVPARTATRVFPPSATREANRIPIFRVFMRMGLVPPFSDFFIAVLESFGLKLLNLTPGAVLDLTLFAYACEAFVGVAPSVALFCHFFYPRACKEGWMGGGVTFYFRPNIKAAGYPEITIKSKWEEWRAG